MQLKFKDQDVLPQETFRYSHLYVMTCYEWFFNMPVQKYFCVNNLCMFQYFTNFFLENIVKVIMLSLTGKKKALEGLPYP